MSKLLEICNEIAREFEQPLLYSHDEGQEHRTGEGADQFHISIAWSLQPPKSDEDHMAKHLEKQPVPPISDVPHSLLDQLGSLPIHFSEVKVRIGQDVHAIAVRARRQSSA